MILSMFSSLFLFIRTYFEYFVKIPADYNTETDDVDENEYSGKSNDINENIEITNRNEADENEISENTEITENKLTEESSENNKPILTSETDPEAATELNNRKDSNGEINCNSNNGGCEHTCNMIPDKVNNSLVIECSCNNGFYLDSYEGKHCIGK